MKRLLLLFLAVLTAGGCAATRSKLPVELSLAPLPELRVLDGSSGSVAPNEVQAPRIILPEQALTEGELLRELYRFQQHRHYFHSTHRVWPSGLDAYWRDFLSYVNNSLHVLPVSIATLHRLRISLEAEFQFAGNLYGLPSLALIKAHNSTTELIRSQINIRARRISQPDELVIHWPLSHLRISSFYGNRVDPFTGDERFHRGIDLAAPSGTVVYSAAPGTVIRAGWFRGHGQSVTVSHAGGYSTVYSHLSAIFVAPGQQVEEGSTIGQVGSTGRSTGPHLHFEVKHYNKNYDPLEIIEVPKHLGAE